MNPKFSALIVSIVAAALLTFPSPNHAQATGLQQKPNDAQPASTQDEGAICRARVVFVQGHSDFMNREALERELLKRREFTGRGLTITRNREEADIVVEVTRKVFTTRFTISILNGRGGHVLASDSASSIGGTIEPKLADRFVKQLKKSCPER